MQVTVEYTAQIKRAIAVSTEQISLESSATLADLLTKIAALHGKSLDGTLFSANNALHPSVLVFVNDEQVRQPEKCVLTDGATVTFLSPISGG